MTEQSDGGRERVTISVSMYDYQKEQVKERADDRGMGMSEYVRAMLAAGERQLTAVTDAAESSEREAIRNTILETLPNDESDAIHQDKLIDGVTDPVEQLAYDILKNDDRIEYSPIHQGYYQV